MSVEANLLGLKHRLLSGCYLFWRMLVTTEAIVVIMIIWGALTTSLSFFFKKREYKYVRFYPFVLIIKTNKFTVYIERIAKKVSKKFAYPLMIFGLFLIGFSIYFLFSNIMALLLTPAVASPVEPLIPGITLGISSLPYALFSLSIAIIFHEVAHAIFIVQSGVSIKSGGIYFIFFIVGGFVEPEEEQFKQLSPKKKVTIASAGPVSNLVIGVLSLTLLLALPFLLSAFYGNPSGVLVFETVEDGPMSNLVTPFVIVSINGSQIKTLEDLDNTIDTLHPNDKINVSLLFLGDMPERKTITIICGHNPLNQSRAFLGIRNFYTYYPPKPFSLGPLFPIIYYYTLIWLALINLSLAIFNMLPIPFFDGDIYLSSVILIKETKLRKILYALIRFMALVLLSGNIIMSFMRFGVFTL